MMAVLSCLVPSSTSRTEEPTARTFTADPAATALIKHDDIDGAGVTLSKDGFFLNSSRFFYPVGVNYWPASTGCNLWTAKPFPSAEIQHDLDVLAASPFNSLRIFIEWGALAPTEGGFDEEKFANLALMLGWIKQRGLLVDISTFMGWMSGRHYWPSWKQGRNMYTDATMISRTVAFAAKVAKTAAPFRANLLAMEFGNEMDCCTDVAPTKDIIAWTHLIYAAFKQNAGASVLVVPGTDENTIIGKSTWPLGGVTGRIAGDVLNFHPYPVLFTPTKVHTMCGWHVTVYLLSGVPAWFLVPPRAECGGLPACARIVINGDPWAQYVAYHRLVHCCKRCVAMRCLLA